MTTTSGPASGPTSGPSSGTPAATPAGTPAGTSPRPPPVVLVVEDNEPNLKLVRDVLTYAGFVVRESRTGEEGVEAARADRPDIVLMDLQLPGIDGVEAQRRLRADPETAGLPIIAVTASAMKEDRVRAFDAGFDGYLEKPISVRDLATQVREFLDPAAGHRDR